MRNKEHILAVYHLEQARHFIGLILKYKINGIKNGSCDTEYWLFSAREHLQNLRDLRNGNSEQETLSVYGCIYA